MVSRLLQTYNLSKHRHKLPITMFSNLVRKMILPLVIQQMILLLIHLHHLNHLGHLAKETRLATMAQHPILHLPHLQLETRLATIAQNHQFLLLHQNHPLHQEVTMLLTTALFQKIILIILSQIIQEVEMRQLKIVQLSKFAKGNQNVLIRIGGKIGIPQIITTNHLRKEERKTRKSESAI